MIKEKSTNSQEKKTNSQKILEYLQENIGEISNEELARETKIDKSNIPREIKKLEKQGYNISKRYEQIGRSKFVWFQLTNRQEKKTNSHFKKPIKKDIISESSKPKIQPKIVIEKRIPEKVIFTKQVSQEVKIFDRTIPLDKISDIARKTLENSRNMIKGIKYYLDAWRKRYNEYKTKKPENFLIDEYESMKETLDFLYKMKEFNKKLRDREGVD